MTQEQKARAYDEALKIARDYWETDNNNTLDIKAKGTMEYLFPELCESEDERIRKELIKETKGSEVRLFEAVTNDEFVAWLEKQGEKKPVVFKAEDWYVSKVDGKIYNAKFMGKKPINQARKLEIEKAAISATGIIEQEEWFIKGAEWAYEQMLQDAIEARLYLDGDFLTLDYDFAQLGMKLSDKVKVIIIKE